MPGPATVYRSRVAQRTAYTATQAGIKRAGSTYFISLIISILFCLLWIYLMIYIQIPMGILEVPRGGCAVVVVGPACLLRPEVAH